MFMSHKTEGGGLLPPAVEIGGPFTLASSRGGTVFSADLSGKPYAVFFGFTHCPEVCPTTLYELSGSLEKLGNAASGMRVFFITVDPERDTPEILKAYMTNFDPTFLALIPSTAALPALAKDFKVYYKKVEGQTPTSYSMDHTAGSYIYDPRGKLRLYTRYGSGAAALAADIALLIKGA
jgi:protein SCO1/2